MRKVCLLIIMGILLLSCRKERTFHLTAKNAVTGQAYPGLNYYIVEEKEGYNGTNYTTLKTGTLDGNGEKLVPVKIHKDRSYVIRLDPPPNWCYMNNVSYSYTSQGDKNPSFDFTFSECAYLTLSVNNTNCQDANDRILFDLQPTYIPNYNNIIPVEKFGCYSNTFVESQVPFGSWEATWEVTRNGITTYHDSIFTMNENEHYNFVINY